MYIWCPHFSQSTSARTNFADSVNYVISQNLFAGDDGVVLGFNQISDQGLQTLGSYLLVKLVHRNVTISPATAQRKLLATAPPTTWNWRDSGRMTPVSRPQNTRNGSREEGGGEGSIYLSLMRYVCKHSIWKLAFA